MVLEAFENYLFFGVIGFAAGILVTRLYFRSSIQRRDISRVIEYAMIEKNISMIESLTKELNKLVSKIQEEGDELESQIKLSKDMETMFRSQPAITERVQDTIMERVLHNIEKKRDDKDDAVKDYEIEPVD
ncbi:MAG: hypothetical protein NWE75_02000 [Candidatus Bathyarchaeota archaeon]|jgi:hypothetical protein|nr:hypothetical protein [Candidatus Bathyarchaeota archaeon]